MSASDGDPAHLKLAGLEALVDQQQTSEAAARHRAQGKLTARERIRLLTDEGTFEELDRFALPSPRPGRARQLGDAVVTGLARVGGRPVALYAQDATVLAGTLGPAHAKKICKVMDHAGRLGAPLIALNDSGGGRIQEGIEALAGYGEVFFRNTALSGVIPQISAVMGPCAGGAVYSPAITDFVFMTEDTSYMFITGPDVIRAVTNETVTKAELGGDFVHASRSGACHVTAPNDASLLVRIRELLAYLPANSRERPPVRPTGDPIDRDLSELDTIVPLSPTKPYDVRTVVVRVLDEGTFFEVHELFAPNIVIGFGRIGGRVLGIVANQPSVLAGCLDIDASRKAARFVRFCDCFNIPLVTMVDVPGFLPGTTQEHEGIIPHGAKLLYAFSEATVPKITVILRKAYGGAYDVMASKHVRADFNLAFPTAEIAVVGAEAAVNILHRRELQAAASPAELQATLVADYRARFANPYLASEHGFIDEVIYPRQLRRRIHDLLVCLDSKEVERPWRKHGNIPL